MTGGIHVQRWLSYTCTTLLSCTVHTCMLYTTCVCIYMYICIYGQGWSYFMYICAYTNWYCIYICMYPPPHTQSLILYIHMDRDDVWASVEQVSGNLRQVLWFVVRRTRKCPGTLVHLLTVPEFFSNDCNNWNYNEL